MKHIIKDGVASNEELILESIKDDEGKDTGSFSIKVYEQPGSPECCFILEKAEVMALINALSRGAK